MIDISLGEQGSQTHAQELKSKKTHEMKGISSWTSLEVIVLSSAFALKEMGNH